MHDTPARVLVSDFDGTITKFDFYELIVGHLLPEATSNEWIEYRSGRITHFEALRRYFAAIRAEEATVWKLVEQMEIDPRLAESVKELRAANWEVVIASAGCRWYIDRLLGEAGVDLEVHSNPGQFHSGRGLLMELPHDSPFFSPTHGISKAAIVQHHLAMGSEVAFAGDGFPDEEAALLVPAERRFARGDLARVLSEAGQAFLRFHVWSEIAQALIAAGRSK